MQLSFRSPRLLPQSSCCSDVLTANGNVLQLGGPGVPKRVAPKLKGDLLAPDAPAQQLQRASPVGHLAAALPHGLTQARLPLVVGLQGREKDQALEKVVARSRNLPQKG